MLLHRPSSSPAFSIGVALCRPRKIFPGSTRIILPTPRPVMDPVTIPPNYRRIGHMLKSGHVPFSDKLIAFRDSSSVYWPNFRSGRTSLPFFFFLFSSCHQFSQGNFIRSSDIRISYLLIVYLTLKRARINYVNFIRGQGSLVVSSLDYFSKRSLSRNGMERGESFVAFPDEFPSDAGRMSVNPCRLVV